VTNLEGEFGMKRRVLRWVLAIVIVLLLAGGLAWRVVTSREVIDSVPLSTGQYNVRFLKADVGKLSYSSDDSLRAFLRPRLPGMLVKKLGEVTNVRGYTGWRAEFGEAPLVLLFQFLTPQNTIQNNSSMLFGKIEFPESTGFVFAEEITGYSSHGQGTSIHQFEAFPRREPTLSFRLYEKDGKLLMEKSFPNPGYRTDFPTWTPEELPLTKKGEGLEVTLKSLMPMSKWRQVSPTIEVRSDDPSWENPRSTHTWTDATGNAGEWLSPFEPAWKLHLRLRRRHDAEFPASAIWKIASLSVPTGLTLTNIDQQQVVDGVGMRVRYVAPAAEIRDEGGVITLTPPRNPGRTGMNHSTGSTTVGGKIVNYTSIESGMPYVRLDHDPLPPGVELVCDVRDQNGVHLNNNLPPGGGGVNGVYYKAVYYTPGPDTKTVSLEVRVSRPKDFEFVIAPPAELRQAIKAPAAK
jgi:hypothetical protein